MSKKKDKLVASVVAQAAAIKAQPNFSSEKAKQPSRRSHKKKQEEKATNQISPGMKALNEATLEPESVKRENFSEQEETISPLDGHVFQFNIDVPPHPVLLNKRDGSQQGIVTPPITFTVLFKEYPTEEEFFAGFIRSMGNDRAYAYNVGEQMPIMHPAVNIVGIVREALSIFGLPKFNMYSSRSLRNFKDRIGVDWLVNRDLPDEPGVKVIGAHLLRLSVKLCPLS